MTTTLAPSPADEAARKDRISPSRMSHEIARITERTRRRCLSVPRIEFARSGSGDIGSVQVMMLRVMMPLDTSPDVIHSDDSDTI